MLNNMVMDLKIAAPMTFVSLVFIFVGELRIMNPLNRTLAEEFIDNFETLLTLFV